MTLQHVDMVKAVCNKCGRVYEIDDEPQVFDNENQAQVYVENYPGDWTTDGEGGHHCDSCSLIAPLELTADVLAERARRITPADVPLDLEGL